MFAPVIEMLMAGWGFCVALATELVQQAVELIKRVAVEICKELVAEVAGRLALMRLGL